MELADGGQKDATIPQDLSRGRAQGVAPLDAKRDRHSLRRRAQHHRTPRRRVTTTRDGGCHYEPGDIHGQRSLRHRPTHGHCGKSHGRARHREHQALRCLTKSMSQPGQQCRKKPGTRTWSQRRRRCHRTNPWYTNRRRCGHQDRQPRTGAVHPPLLNTRPWMQAQ